MDEGKKSVTDIIESVCVRIFVIIIAGMWIQWMKKENVI